MSAENTGGDGAVLQRGGVVVQLDQLREAPPDIAHQGAQGGNAVPVEIGRCFAGFAFEQFRRRVVLLKIDEHLGPVARMKR